MGNAYTSPLKRWDVCCGLLQEIKAKTFVEVGVKEGRLSAAVLKNIPDIHVIAIDPWAPIPNSDEDYSAWNFADIERQFWDNIGEHKDRCIMLRMTSAESAERFNTESDPTRTLLYTSENGLNGAQFEVLPPIDMVFIDAGHDYNSVMADIRAWWPLVREGGILAGHDFQHRFPGVMRAVADSFPLLRVAVCPDSVWVVEKMADLQVAA